MTRVTVSFPDVDIYPQVWETRHEAQRFADVMADLYPEAKIIVEDLPPECP